MPYRAHRIFDYRSNYRYINYIQVVLVDTSTFQLINHVHCFFACEIISSTYAFQLKSDDIVTENLCLRHSFNIISIHINIWITDTISWLHISNIVLSSTYL